MPIWSHDCGSSLDLFVLRFYDPVNQMGHAEHGQYTEPHFYWAGLVL